jgi:hypothetical protein
MTSTAWSLVLLRAFGLDPAGPEARKAVRRVREHVAWEHDGEPFFAGEVRVLRWYQRSTDDGSPANG